ncbi:conserved hypothetical protein [Ricinus communis]|uniref:TmcB/TmcC TPR repeats domain-containing protein n=1 Tax=Ricinus communis TaxID=3988 RepID=B9SNT4_RICCO|nr:conserved hypothetical protein [Ricinus communis]|eukprot:XP_002527653.1 uncharacterized protein LOC8289072 [Ricinus communis]
MKSLLLRTGSIQAHAPVTCGSPKLSLSRRNSISSVLSGEKSTANSPKFSLHLEINSRKRDTLIRRALSETDIIRSETEEMLSRAGSMSFPARILEEEYSNLTYIWPENGIPLEELGFSSGGDGFGKGKNSGGGNGGVDGNSSDDLSKIGDYYTEMLKSNPNDSLLLRNYGKFLHEVEGDMERAEEYYGRAILAGPGDGEVLSLYGKLIWDRQRDGERAKAYFDQAVSAAPHDCMVMGSYAHFMWEAEEEEEEEINSKAQISPAMVVAL